MPNQTLPFFVDPKNIVDAVSEKTYRLGLNLFNSNCVLECDIFPDQIVASVEAQDSELPHLVKIELNEDTGLATSMSCYCNEYEEVFCCHAVAVLLHCSDQYQDELEQYTAQQLQETALLDRIKKGQKEVNVEAVNTVSDYGEWRASSIVSATHRQVAYTVTIRSLTERQNTCTCPDWRNNQLGTCKHVEAVLHEIRRKNNNQLPAIASAKPYIYRGWEGREPVLKLQRTAAMPAELLPVLERFFDKAGHFTGQLPEAFYELQSQLYDSPEIDIGSDAVSHVQTLQNRLNHALRKREIQEQIQLNGERIAGVNAKLFPYQVEGVAFLASNGRALLADDMGLGKTLQSITAAFWLHRYANVQKVLIICPASLKGQWAREIEKFTGMQSQIVQGNAHKRLQQYRNNALFVIMNYETAIPDLEAINTMVAPDLIILDEAQRLKNWRTKIASCVKLISSKYAFVLTGTPLENKLEELYSVMQIVDPEYLGPLWRFMADFHVTDEKGKVLAYRNLSELRNSIAPVMLRRNRSIVSKQLPAMTKIRIDVPMTNQQIGMHEEAMNAAGRLAEIAKSRPLTPTERNRLMSGLQRARMACNAAGLVDKESKGAPKLEELRRLFTEICIDSGEKVVVFSCWKLMTTMIEQLTKEMKLGSVHLHGGVPSARRGELMQTFHEDDSVSVFIATDAGSTGLNLQCATTLINVDVPWTPAIIEQRNARIHRLGQSKNVRIISLISNNSYEQRVLALVNSKQDLFNSTIIGDSENDVIAVGGKGLSSLIGHLQQESQQPETGLQTTDEMPEADTALIDTALIESETPIVAQASFEINPETAIVEPERAIAEPKYDNGVEQIIVALEKQFANRIERINARKDQVIVVLDQINDEDEIFVENLADAPHGAEIPVALIEQRSMRQLQKLSPENWQENSKESEQKSALKPEYLQAEQSAEQNSEQNKNQNADSHPHRTQTNPWHSIAADKLQTARLLHQQVLSGAMDMLSASACAKISALVNANEQITPENASLALYTNEQLLELLTLDQVATLTKVFNLSRINSEVPAALTATLLDEFQAIADTF